MIRAFGCCEAVRTGITLQKEREREREREREKHRQVRAGGEEQGVEELELILKHGLGITVDQSLKQQGRGQ